jgi:NitT/TauT family transport system ATP-binding protein
VVEACERAIAGDFVIRLRQLRVSFGAEEVLHGIDLRVRRGEFLSIVGKSGAGKSTLLHALARFVPSEGEHHSPEKCGIVFQSYAVYPFLTVAGNVGLGLIDLRAADRQRIIAEYLELVGLSAHADKYPAQLSGGQNQRIAIARAFAARQSADAPPPAAIYCDEPFGALDPFTRDKMQSWLLEIWERHKTTIVFVTHSIEEALFLSDRVVVMSNGTLVKDFAIPFPRPRTAEIKFDAVFVELKRQVLESMEPAES